MKSVTILGATGSIGQNTFDLISQAAGAFRVEALTGARNIVRLARDARRLRARLVVTSEPDLFYDLKELLAGVDVEIAAGPQAVAEDSVLSAIFQAVTGKDMAAVERLIITASDGALRDWPLNKIGTGDLGPSLLPSQLGDGPTDHDRQRVDV